MIYDRTVEDVINAKNIRDTKVKEFSELTESEKNILERGTITVNTLNRIESKQKELQNTFRGLGYYLTVQNKSWSCSDVFTSSDLQRIVHNTLILKDAFFAFQDTPKVVEPQYHFEEINKMEKILYDLGKNAEYIQNNFLECDTFYCGEY